MRPIWTLFTECSNLVCAKGVDVYEVVRIWREARKLETEGRAGSEIASNRPKIFENKGG
jgi:hypothetical protein